MFHRKEKRKGEVWQKMDLISAGNCKPVRFPKRVYAVTSRLWCKPSILLQLPTKFGGISSTGTELQKALAPYDR